jgi:hypothetical protein
LSRQEAHRTTEELEDGMTVTPSRFPLDLVVADEPMPDVDELIARTSALLADGVPLSLLLDLAGGPHSEELWADEAPELAWLQPRDGARPVREAG